MVTASVCHKNAMTTKRSQLSTDFAHQDAGNAVDWFVSHRPVAYDDAVDFMEERAAQIARGEAGECVWLLEHPPLYTAGTSAKEADLVDRDCFPVFKTGRGGQYTYHGPGQRIAYVMLNLKQRQPDVRRFVSALEQWIIATLDDFNIKGERREDRVGVWVQRPEKPAATGTIAEDKIAALGIRLKKWVSLHGISINVEPELDHFEGIVPCGVREHGVTSLVDLGLPVTLEGVDVVLRQNFEHLFGATRNEDAPFP